MRLLLLVLSVFLCVPLFAQVEIDFPKKGEKELASHRGEQQMDLTGLWEGQITQLTWNGEPSFQGATGKLHVEITQTGNKISGVLVCRAKFAKNLGYLSYEKYFKGTWDGQRMWYEDEYVDNYINTHKEMRHLETCLKQASLQFYSVNGYDHLEGEWEGKGHISDVPCVPGKIHLKRVKDEELALEEAQTVNVNFSQLDKRPVEIKWNNKNKIKRIKTRKVEPGRTITVDSDYFSITVYDHKKDDGDIVSLNYNGNWILEKFQINHDEHEVDVFLDPDGNNPNYLVLYAHNLGKYPPNTVAIIIDDGVRRQRSVLHADMNTSDVIYFKRRKRK